MLRLIHWQSYIHGPCDVIAPATFIHRTGTFFFLLVFFFSHRKTLEALVPLLVAVIVHLQTKLESKMKASVGPLNSPFKICRSCYYGDVNQSATPSTTTYRPTETSG
jgi:hypothetical protein